MQQTGLKLLESLLRGRSVMLEDNATDKSSEVVHLTLSVLPSASASRLCRALVFQAYGVLLGSDWLAYSDKNPGSGLEYHLRIILGHCGGPGRPATIRSAACKAVGDICSNCFLVENVNGDVSLFSKEHLKREEYLRQIGDDVCKAMLRSTEDSNASVRSMVSVVPRVFVDKSIAIRSLIRASFFLGNIYCWKCCSSDCLRQLPHSPRSDDFSEGLRSSLRLPGRRKRQGPLLNSDSYVSSRVVPFVLTKLFFLS